MEGMLEIGGKLRAERERQGRSLDEVYQATRITIRYLESIEAGEFERIPGEVYLKGFLRRYAAFLGMDGEELVRQYQERKASLEQPSAPEGATQRRLARSGGGHPNRSARLGLVFAATILAAIASGWALAIWSTRFPIAGRPRPSVEAPGSRVVEPPAPAETPSEEAAAAAEQAAPVAPVRVSVELTDRCWFRVSADGQLVYEGELAAGDRREWTAQDRLNVRIGNPRGVTLTWNGQPVTLDGREPLTRLFTKEAVVVSPSPYRSAPTSAPAPPVQVPAEPQPARDAAEPSPPGEGSSAPPAAAP
ncbi:MAG: RodZ domain-containing protein [Betaproteobacteria bacterium]